MKRNSKVINNITISLKINISNFEDRKSNLRKYSDFLNSFSYTEKNVYFDERTYIQIF